MVKPQGGSKASKKAQPPVFSHEFVIQNHGDIMSCVLMVFIVGLMFPLTHSLSEHFIMPQYNGSHVVAEGVEHAGYLSGLLDLPAFFFYTIAVIVTHAVIQEYLLDKVLKRTHLSKVSTFKFSDSFHSAIFAAYAICHGVYVIAERPQNFSDVQKIWSGYPLEQRVMSAQHKLFFLIQIGYWLHQFPEFYLQKLKRDEMRQKTTQSLVHLFFITLAYFFNFTRCALVLLLVEYTTQIIFHGARTAHFSGRKYLSQPLFKAYNVVFVLAKFASAILAVMTFWYGLRQTEAPFVDVANGNFNTAAIRLNILLAVVLLQLYQLFSFVSFHLGRLRESSVKKEKKKAAAAAAALVPKKEKKRNESESDSKKKN